MSNFYTKGGPLNTCIPFNGIVLTRCPRCGKEQQVDVFDLALDCEEGDDIFESHVICDDCAAATPTSPIETLRDYVFDLVAGDGTPDRPVFGGGKGNENEMFFNTKDGRFVITITKESEETNDA